MTLRSTGAALAGDLPLGAIRLPDGFSIEVLARVANARQMAIGDGNIVYVGSAREGKVHAIQLDGQYLSLIHI